MKLEKFKATEVALFADLESHKLIDTSLIILNGVKPQTTALRLLEEIRAALFRAENRHEK